MRALLSLILAAGIAAGADRGDWQNLAQLEAGRKIEVFTGRGKAKGEFVRFDQDALTIREKNGARAVPRAEVTRVSTSKRSRGIWIGVAAGAATGAIAGGLLSSRLANESGGDFANAKGPVTALTAAFGALIGALIGGVARRSHVVFSK
jgi:hypothetical protein